MIKHTGAETEDDCDLIILVVPNKYPVQNIKIRRQFGKQRWPLDGSKKGKKVSLIANPVVKDERN